MRTKTTEIIGMAKLIGKQGKKAGMIISGDAKLAYNVIKAHKSAPETVIDSTIIPAIVFNKFVGFVKELPGDWDKLVALVLVDMPGLYAQVQKAIKEDDLVGAIEEQDEEVAGFKTEMHPRYLLGNVFSDIVVNAETVLHGILPEQDKRHETLGKQKTSMLIKKDLVKDVPGFLAQIASTYSIPKILQSITGLLSYLSKYFKEKCTGLVDGTDPKEDGTDAEEVVTDAEKVKSATFLLSQMERFGRIQRESSMNRGNGLGSLPFLMKTDKMEFTEMRNAVPFRKGGYLFLHSLLKEEDSKVLIPSFITLQADFEIECITLGTELAEKLVGIVDEELKTKTETAKDNKEAASGKANPEDFTDVESDEDLSK